MTKKILITGGKGFIGKHVVNWFNSQPHVYETYAPYFNINDQANTQHVVTAINPDVIIHLAGKAVPGVNPSKWSEMVNVNIAGTANLLSAASYGCRFIFASSIVVYGDWVTDPFSCEAPGHTENDPCSPKSLYATTKLSAEELVQHFTDASLIEGISLRLCAVVGSGLTHGALKDLIKKAADRNTDELVIMGNDPGSIKPYIHIDDVVNCIQNAMFSSEVGPMNVCSVDSISISYMVDIIEAHLWNYHNIKPKKRVWNKQTFVGDNPYLAANPMKAKKTLDLPTIKAGNAIARALIDMTNKGEI